MNSAVDFSVVFGTLALALGLAAVTAGLTSLDGLPEESAQDSHRMVVVGGRWHATRSSAAKERRVDSLVMRLDVAREPAQTVLPLINAAGPWVSPLYPQNGVTLWDRIRVSAERDRRAFLMGAAIQAHAPASAATPGPRLSPVSSSCCPR